MLSFSISLHTQHQPSHTASACTRSISLHMQHQPAHASACTRISLHTQHQPALGLKHAFSLSERLCCSRSGRHLASTWQVEGAQRGPELNE